MKQKTLFGTFSSFVSLNIVGMLGLSCYILADTFFVANGLGTNGLASLNLAISIYSFIQATGLLIGVGGATKYAILKSQNDDRANSFFTNSIFLGIFFAFIFVVVGIFASEPLSYLLGANADTIEMTNTYLKTILCFSPFFIINNILIAFIRNDNAPNLAMGGMLIGSLSNILLDYVFVFPLKMGMFGAAFATGLAPIISIALLSFHFIKKKNSFRFQPYKDKLKTKFKAMLNILSLGISSFFTEISSGIILIVFNIVILQIVGNVGVAAYGIVANLALVAISLFVGIAQGIQPLVSKSFGQNNKKQLNALLKYALILSLIISVIVYLVINVFATQIISIFNSENNILLAQYAKSGLLIYFTGFLFAGFNIVIISFLNSSQNPKKAFLISIIRGFIAMIPLVFLLSHFFGIIGIWIVFPLAEMLTSIIVLLMFVKQKNK